MPDDQEARERLIGNERTKLTCTFVNNIAGSVTFAGVIAPVASVLYTFTLPASPYWGAFVLCWSLIAISFHAIARMLLKGLIP